MTTTLAEMNDQQETGGFLIPEGAARAYYDYWINFITHLEAVKLAQKQAEAEGRKATIGDAMLIYNTQQRPEIDSDAERP